MGIFTVFAGGGLVGLPLVTGGLIVVQLGQYTRPVAAGRQEGRTMPNTQTDNIQRLTDYINQQPNPRQFARLLFAAVVKQQPASDPRQQATNDR